MQIKTIKNRLDNAESFDKAVNEALSDGYILLKRKVLEPQQPHTNDNTWLHTMLYAELVKYDPEDILGDISADEETDPLEYQRR